MLSIVLQPDERRLDHCPWGSAWARGSGRARTPLWVHRDTPKFSACLLMCPHTLTCGAPGLPMMPHGYTRTLTETHESSHHVAHLSMLSHASTCIHMLLHSRVSLHPQQATPQAWCAHANLQHNLTLLPAATCATAPPCSPAKQACRSPHVQVHTSPIPHSHSHHSTLIGSHLPPVPSSPPHLHRLPTAKAGTSRCTLQQVVGVPCWGLGEGEHKG